MDDVSLAVNKGEFVSIIGRTGSGKSTLLKIIAGIYKPDAGEVKVEGKALSILGMGTGFNSELTGLENIYLNAAILGVDLDSKGLENKLDKIIEFSELGKFIDQKLSTYSRGMKARLGLSIALFAPKDIMIIDEALSGGDERFKNKCTRRFEAMIANKKTIIFVTHSLSTAEKYSDKIILLDQGRIINQGLPREVISQYKKIINN